jgi:hypothetical protein
MEAIARHYQPAIAFATDFAQDFSRGSIALAMPSGIAEEGPALRDIFARESNAVMDLESWTWD